MPTKADAATRLSCVGIVAGPIDGFSASILCGDCGGLERRLGLAAPRCVQTG